MIRAIFKLILFFEALCYRYRVDFFRYKFRNRLAIPPSVRFGKRTSVIIFSGSSSICLKIGEGCDFRQNCLLTVDGEGVIDIGDKNFFNNGCSINCQGIIKIGEGNLFGENVKIYDHSHKYLKMEIPIREQGFNTGKVIIGKNCWFGSNCIILNNVEIGDNVVIGANNLIYKSIPSNTIVRTGITPHLVPR